VILLLDLRTLRVLEILPRPGLVHRPRSKKECKHERVVSFEFGRMRWSFLVLEPVIPVHDETRGCFAVLHKIRDGRSRFCGGGIVEDRGGRSDEDTGKEMKRRENTIDVNHDEKNRWILTMPFLPL